MKYLSNKSPCMKYLSNKMSIYEMFSIKSSYMKYLSNEMSFYEMFFNEMSVYETFVQLNVLLWNICPNEISQKHGFYLISGISTTSAAVSTISTILFSVISKQQTPSKIVCLLYFVSDFFKIKKLYMFARKNRNIIFSLVFKAYKII